LKLQPPERELAIKLEPDRPVVAELRLPKDPLDVRVNLVGDPRPLAGPLHMVVDWGTPPVIRVAGPDTSDSNKTTAPPPPPHPDQGQNDGGKGANALMVQIAWGLLLLVLVLLAGVFGGWIRLQVPWLSGSPRDDVRADAPSARPGKEPDVPVADAAALARKERSQQWLATLLKSESVLTGIASAFLVPVFLQVSSSGLIKNGLSSASDGLVFIGYCLLAAIVGPDFLLTMLAIFRRILKGISDPSALEPRTPNGEDGRHGNAGDRKP
jgi:hypothetical protein